MAESRRRQTIRAAISYYKNFQYSDVDNFNGVEAEHLNSFIDHTLLRPDATAEDIRKLCKEALKYDFRTVCVNSSWIELCDSLLQSPESVPLPIAVVGFPLGAGITAAKAFEAKAAIDAGAKEIDMVIHIGRLKQGDYDYVYEDIKAVYDTCGKIPLKVILETVWLTNDEIIAACIICKEINVAFVKTCTGFGGGGATAEHVGLMKKVVGDHIEVKASGGIRTYDDAVKMLNAGATRIGASASIAIVTGH